MEILALFGLLVGFMAGFFGVGGGTVLVPLLMGIGYSIKESVGISIIQMVFTSLYGSYLNFKAGKLVYGVVLWIALGGTVGAFISSYIVLYLLSETFLEWMFIFFIVLSIIKLLYTPTQPLTQRHPKPWILVSLGVFIGIAATSIGVGGALFITPFLNAYMGYPLKKAVVASLFFVMFSSIFAFTSWGLQGALRYEEGFIIGVFSLLGVFVGLKAAHHTKAGHFKALLLLLNGVILGFLLLR